MPEVQNIETKPKACDKCGRLFRCGVEEGDPQSCWCFSMDPVSFIEPIYQDCLCPVCLKSYADPSSLKEAPASLKEGEDFQFNADGLMELTSSFLWKRGYCCQNHCRHCPYGFSKNAVVNPKR
jgi:hypothetical protein